MLIDCSERAELFIDSSAGNFEGSEISKKYCMDFKIKKPPQ